MKDRKLKILKPCPCCGSPAIMRGYNYIYCSNTVNCGLSLEQSDAGDYKWLKEFTINAWNKRI